MSVDELDDFSGTPVAYSSYPIAASCPYLNGDLAPMCYTAAAYLSKLAALCSSFYFRVMSPILPGEYDQCSSTVTEVAMRALYAVSMIPLALVGGVTGLLGLGIRSIGVCLQKNSFSHLLGSAPEKQFLADQEIRVMTWNVCAPGGGFPRSAAGVLEWESRIDGIEKLIKEASPDVFCLQEAHDVNFQDELYARLKDTYSHFYYHVGQGSLTANSGLFVASKYPVNDFQFTCFRDYLGVAFWINKGFASFSVGDQFRVIATHLQHEEPEIAAGVRNRQLNQVVNHVKELSRKTPVFKTPVFFMGDCNIRKGDAEYDSSILSKNFVHGTDSLEPTCTDFFEKHLWSATAEERERGIQEFRERIDYLALLSSLDEKDLEVQSIAFKVFTIAANDTEKPSEALSDHHALLGRFTL